MAGTMTDNDFHRELLSRLRAIANNCIDPWAIERLRIMASDIEQHLGVGPTMGTGDSAERAGLLGSQS
jgi:hypothetical protein